MKELKEMTSEELLEQIKADANAELYGNVDEPEEDSNKIKNIIFTFIGNKLIYIFFFNFPTICIST